MRRSGSDLTCAPVFALAAQAGACPAVRDATITRYSDRLLGAARRRGGTRRRGFTLLEILIATGILTIGLASVVSLFPVAINVGRKVIETSNAVVIAQSVAEAIRDGIRNRKAYITSRGDSSTYFILQHDGVTDEVPPPGARLKVNADYFILLPTHEEGLAFKGGSEDRLRIRSVQEGKTFLYPEVDRPANGNGDVRKARNDAVDGNVWDIPVTKVYRLGQQLTSDKIPADFRLLDLDREVLKQYSFAFTITPSFFDADVSSTRDFAPAGRLFHVRILVYRSFPELGEVDGSLDDITLPEPVYDLDFEVAT